MKLPIRRLEHVFNMMYKKDEYSLPYLNYREENCEENLMNIFNSCLKDTTSSDFDFFRQSGILKDQLPDLKESFTWNRKIHKGTILFFNRKGKENIDDLFDSNVFTDKDLDVLLESRKLVVSSLLGKFVRVRDVDSAKAKVYETDPKTGIVSEISNYRDKKITEKYYHISRFKKNMALLSVPHNFKRHVFSIPSILVGQIVTHCPSMKQYKVDTISDSSSSLVVYDLKDEKKQLPIEKPKSHFRASYNDAAGRTKDGLIKLFDYVKINPDFLNDAMTEMGWKVILANEIEHYKYWRNCLKFLFAKAVNFENSGITTVVQFDDRHPVVKENGLSGFCLTVPTKMLIRWNREDAEKVLEIQSRREDGDLSDGEQSFIEEMGKKRNRRKRLLEQERLEKEKKEKELTEREEEDKFDRSKGPYNLDYLHRKLVTLVDFKNFEGNHGLVEEVDNELGHIHVKFYKGRSITPFYFRASLGHDKNFKIISDIVVSDEND